MSKIDIKTTHYNLIRFNNIDSCHTSFKMESLRKYYCLYKERLDSNSIFCRELNIEFFKYIRYACFVDTQDWTVKNNSTMIRTAKYEFTFIIISKILQLSIIFLISIGNFLNRRKRVMMLAKTTYNYNEAKLTDIGLHVGLFMEICTQLHMQLILLQ